MCVTFIYACVIFGLWIIDLNRSCSISRYSIFDNELEPAHLKKIYTGLILGSYGSVRISVHSKLMRSKPELHWLVFSISVTNLGAYSYYLVRGPCYLMSLSECIIGYIKKYFLLLWLARVLPSHYEFLHQFISTLNSFCMSTNPKDLSKRRSIGSHSASVWPIQWVIYGTDPTHNTPSDSAVSTWSSATSKSSIKLILITD